LHSVADYYRMAEAGILAREAHVELIDGEIIDTAPMGSRHASVVDRLVHLFKRAVGDRAWVRSQNPIRLGDFSEPEPDLALLRWRDDFYAAAHPAANDVLLIVEVADSSLQYDRDIKLPLYARHGIPEVWLIDLDSNRAERFITPGKEAYGECLELSGTVAPILLPDCRIELPKLLPG